MRAGKSTVVARSHVGGSRCGEDGARDCSGKVEEFVDAAGAALEFEDDLVGSGGVGGLRDLR